MVGPLLTLLAVAAYGAFHSVLAAPAAKALARRALGASADRYYRVTYNLIAAVTFVPVLAVVGLAPGRVLFRVPSPWWILAVVGQAAGLVLILAGLLETDVWHFLGLRQLSAPRPDTHSPLIVTGLYRWVRHPLYAAGLVVLWLSPTMTTSLLAFNATLTVYILIGYHFEEHRLLDAFGPAYEGYRRQVPALIPLPGRPFVPPHDE
jgi:protein-S-isoprenylcysteine O-methyltransferase Ste14